MSFTYHIALTGTAYEEFIPSVEPKVTFQEYAGEIFLRPSIEEIKISQLLNPAIYTSLNAMFFDSSEFGNQLKFWIEDGTTNYYFRSSISNAKNDTEKKLFIISPEPDDEYQDVLDYYDKQYSSLLLGYYGYVWQQPATSFVNVSLTAWSDTGGSVEWTNNEGVGSYYARLHLNGYAAESGKKIKMVIRNLSYTDDILYLRIVNGSATPISNTNVLDDDDIYTFTLTAASADVYIEFESVSIDPAAGSFDYEAYYYKDYKTLGNTVKNVINKMLTNIGSSLTVKSTYLFNDAVPSVVPSAIATYIAANPTKDYVTEDTAIWNYLWLGQTDSLATDTADTHELSMRELMDMLKVKLRTFWYIDSDGYFRIEHQKYFREWDPQFDLTSAAYTKYKPEIDMMLYNYRKDNIVSEINCEELNESNDDFVAYPISYDVIKTTPNARSLAPPKLSCDIGWIIDNPDDADASGFVLMQCDYFNSTYVVAFAESEFNAGYYYQNERLSWAYLFKRYWQYFAEADTADINNGETLTPDHIKEFLCQSGIKFYKSSEVNWYQPITLTRGRAWVRKIEHDLSSGFFTLEVGYGVTDIFEELTADSTTITADTTLITADAV